MTSTRRGLRQLASRVALRMMQAVASPRAARRVPFSAEEFSRYLSLRHEPHDPQRMHLPLPVPRELDAPLREYWFQRAAQHLQDWYAGVPISKLPEDLRVYEHLLWQSRANVVIELGAQYGGSALWFRDRLRALASYGRIRDPHVISVDSNAELAREHVTAVDPASEGITIIAGDLLDEGLPAIVEGHLPAGASCMVIEDSAHIARTTTAALEGFSRFVPLGGFFIVEDGYVDIEEMRLRRIWPRGVLPALAEWLDTDEGKRFCVREDLELYGLSCHPHGILQRTEAPLR
jgi:cephalosporin hydroxylase